MFNSGYMVVDSSAVMVDTGYVKLQQSPRLMVHPVVEVTLNTWLLVISGSWLMIGYWMLLVPKRKRQVMRSIIPYTGCSLNHKSHYPWHG